MNALLDAHSCRRNEAHNARHIDDEDNDYDFGGCCSNNHRSSECNHCFRNHLEDGSRRDFDRDLDHCPIDYHDHRRRDYDEKIGNGQFLKIIK